ncbi:MAG: SDR family NAD(P)-dependent oxidoreductase [Clostridiales bacterium]|nr:SDR family NAD(P)-dependent oxidoreductase [Clostridiales bacterium]
MKHILVTGAYGGMGRATVDSLKTQGFCVIALDKITGSAAENVISLQADITDADSVKAAFKEVKGITDELYAIVHFAGIYLLDSLVEIENESFVQAFEANLFGAFLVNKTFLPLLKNDSRIVITTSELAPLDPLPFTGIYAVTKGALDKYAYSLRMELQLLGISVSVLRAGAVDTGMLGVSTDALDKFCKNTKLYACNVNRFKRIVDGVEAKSIPTEKVARKIVKILSVNNPKFAYSINRNPLLLLLNALPKRLQLWVIRQVLK